MQLWLGSMDLDAADAARWQLRKSSNFQGLTLSNYGNSSYVLNDIIYYIIYIYISLYDYNICRNIYIV